MALFGCRLIESSGRDVLLVLKQILGTHDPNSAEEFADIPAEKTASSGRKIHEFIRIAKTAAFGYTPENLCRIVKKDLNS